MTRLQLLAAAFLAAAAMCAASPAPSPGIPFTEGRISWTDAVLRITGTSSLEELDQSVMEAFTDLHEHPLDLNAASRSRLLSCGLFTEYQAASILEYRRTHGDILSYSELTLLDGIGPAFGEALRHFVRLESSRSPGRRPESGRVRGSVTARYNRSSGFAFKSDVEFGGRFKLALGSKSGSLAYFGDGKPARLVLGDFNARFGQGLVCWSGFALSGYSTAASFNRHATGIAPCSSFSGSGHLRGVGTDWDFGRLRASAFFSTDGTAGANLTGTWRNCVAGVTALRLPDSSISGSADFKLGVGNALLFGEAGWKGAPAALLGVLFSPEYGRRYALLAKYDGIPSGAAGLQSGNVSATVEGSARQVKLTGTYSPSIGKDGLMFKPAVRICERWKDEGSAKWRSDIRCDATLSYGKWQAGARFNAVVCRDAAWLWYAELGRSGGVLSAYLRGGLFKIDNWDDRIYVYERDAPGSFNVPAYYGRGWNLSMVATLRLGGKKVRNTLNLRLSETRYPRSDKAAREEFKLQYSLKF